MEGGINAWNGIVAEGRPEESLSFFASARSAGEYIALAWHLEEGTNLFYQRVGEMTAGDEAAALYQELSHAEEHHQALLDDLNFRVTGRRIDPGTLRSAAFVLPAGRYVEGGLLLEEAIRRAQGKKQIDIIEMAITLEANAFDRYLFMKGEVEDAPAKEVFTLLAAEERGHLERLASSRPPERGSRDPGITSPEPLYRRSKSS